MRMTKSVRLANSTNCQGVGRECGVMRARGVGLGRGVGEGVTGGVGVGEGVTEGVGVGEGAPQPGEVKMLETFDGGVSVQKSCVKNP